jgi:hypothetical protein
MSRADIVIVGHGKLNWHWKKKKNIAGECKMDLSSSTANGSNHILLATDGSNASIVAYEWAKRLAKEGDTLCVGHSYTTHTPQGGAQFEPTVIRSKFECVLDKKPKVEVCSLKTITSTSSS